MRANYLDHTAFEDGHNIVNLTIQVPDGRILLFKQGWLRQVPRISPDWQITLSKSLVRGKTNKAALEDLVFAKLGLHKLILTDVEFITKFHYSGKSIFAYGLLIEDKIALNPGHGAQVFALPWKTAVSVVLNKEMNFSSETHAVIDVINTFKRGTK